MHPNNNHALEPTSQVCCTREAISMKMHGCMPAQSPEIACAPSHFLAKGIFPSPTAKKSPKRGKLPAADPGSPPAPFAASAPDPPTQEIGRACCCLFLPVCEESGLPTFHLKHPHQEKLRPQQASGFLARLCRESHQLHMKTHQNSKGFWRKPNGS